MTLTGPHKLPFFLWHTKSRFIIPKKKYNTACFSCRNSDITTFLTVVSGWHNGVTLRAIKLTFAQIGETPITNNNLCQDFTH